MARFRSVLFLLFAFLILSNGLANAAGKCKRVIINEDGSKTTIASCSEALTDAERHCTRTVTMDGDTKIITINCSSNYTDINNEHIYKHPNDLKELQEDIFEKSKEAQQSFKDRTGNQSSGQSNSNQKVADIHQKEQDAFNALKDKQQAQKDKY